MTDEPFDMSLYFDALDEIYQLRKALAYEAEVLAVHTTYKSFPKSRRKIADDQITRMRGSARGQAAIAYSGTNYLSLSGAMERAGAKRTMTRQQWENEPARAWRSKGPADAASS